MDDAQYTGGSSYSMSEDNADDLDDDEVDLPKPKRKCPWCDAVYKNNYEWLMHVESSHGKKHDCPVPNCYYRTAHKWYMKRHLSTTHGKNSIRCTVDGCQGFFVKRCMKRHIQTAHNKIKEVVSSSLKNVINQCEICPFKSSKARIFEAHVHDFHSMGFKCQIPECPSPEFLAGDLDGHFQTLHPEVRYKYKLGKGLKVFIDEPETDGCTESATDREEELPYLPEYVAQKFDGFKCSTCSKAFQTQRNLIRHVARVHEKRYHENNVRQKKFPCTVEGCDRAFTTEGLLKDHLNWHQGNYEYECQYCAQKFFARSRFAVHLKKYHLMSIKTVQPKMPLESCEIIGA